MAKIEKDKNKPTKCKETQRNFYTAGRNAEWDSYFIFFNFLFYIIAD